MINFREKNSQLNSLSLEDKMDDIEDTILLLWLSRKRRKSLRLMEKKKQRKFWDKSIFRVRKLKGELHALIQDLKLFDSGYFFKQFQMTPIKLEELLSWVAPRIEKSSVRREPIAPEQRLCVTFRYLVTGDAHVTIATSYRISPASTGRIIKETTDAIWNVLLEKKDFYNHRNHLKIGRTYPQDLKTDVTSHIVLDGKHVIRAPTKSGSLFFNNKKGFSIVLLALCDASYQFTVADIGEAGRQSDGGLFANSDLGRSIINGYFNLPQPKYLYSESEFLFPYVFVGDDAFLMRHNLLKPYSSSNLERVLLIFNYILSR